MGFWLFSGIDGELGWKTVPPTERSIRVNPINLCSKKTGRLNEHGFIGFNGFYQVVILAQRAKHPRQSDKSMFEKKLGGGETNTDCTDITDFIRGAT